MPQVSIIITAFNCASYIEEAIASVVNQSDADLEVIVIDDASTDGTLQRAQAAASRDSRITVHPQPHGGKASIARNAGLALARGEYICFLDGDDRYHPDRVEIQRTFLDATPDAVAVFHDVDSIDETGAMTAPSLLHEYQLLLKAQSYLTRISADTYLCSPQFYIYMSLEHSSVYTSSIMVRRSLLEQHQLRFAEDVHMAEDIELWWAIARGRTIGYIDRPLSSYRMHGTNTTKNIEVLCRDSITVHQRNLARCADVLTPIQTLQYERKIADGWFCLGYFCVCNGRAEEARRYYRTALRQSFERRFIVAYLKSLLPQAIRRVRQRASGTSAN